MHCPVCTDVTLVMTDRQGIEIDYCPQCRGVWLDRGELDKLIERAAASPAAEAAPRSGERERERHHGHYDERHYRKRKKRGLLGELFDFD